MKENHLKRTMYACVLTLLVCSLVPASQVLAEASPSEEKDVQTIAHTLMTESVTAEDILAFSANTTNANAEISNTVLDETFNPYEQGYYSIVTNDDSTVIGFLGTQDAAETLHGILDLLEKHDWTVNTNASNSNEPSSTVATCAKESGTIHWAYISCIQLNEVTSVVIQVHG